MDDKKEDPKAPAAPAGGPEAKPPPSFSEEPDALFRLRLAVVDFIQDNVKNIGYVVGAGLLVALVYGLWDSWHKGRAEAEFETIGFVDFKMPKAAQFSEYGIVPADDPSDSTRLANVEKGAELYESAAKEAHGAAAVYAWLRAAETWRRLGKEDRRLGALKAAFDVNAGDLPSYTAAQTYAGALVDGGKLDEAIAVLQAESLRHTDFYGEQILIQLAQTQIQAGKAADAQATIATFQQKYPSSPRTGRLSSFLAAGGLAPAAPAVAPAAPGATPDATPAAPAPSGG